MTHYERALFIIFSAGAGYVFAGVNGFVVGGIWAILVTLILTLFGRR